MYYPLKIATKGSNDSQAKIRPLSVNKEFSIFYTASVEFMEMEEYAVRTNFHILSILHCDYCTKMKFFITALVNVKKFA